MLCGRPCFEAGEDDDHDSDCKKSSHHTPKKVGFKKVLKNEASMELTRLVNGKIMENN